MVYSQFMKCQMKKMTKSVLAILLAFIMICEYPISAYAQNLGTQPDVNQVMEEAVLLEDEPVQKISEQSEKESDEQVNEDSMESLESQESTGDLLAQIIDNETLSVEEKEEQLKALKEQMMEEEDWLGLIDEMVEATPSRTKGSAFDFKGYTLLDGGEILEVGDYRLKAIDTPGHTPGQMCFEIEGTGAMILGDHVLFDITPNITDWPDVADSLGDYLDSLDKINQYDVVIPLPGHRKPGDFHERIASLMAHHERRLDDCCKVIHDLGHARLYDITGQMRWKIRAASWDTFPPAQRWFALGECLSHIDYLLKRGRIIRHEDEGGIWYEA